MAVRGVEPSRHEHVVLRRRLHNPLPLLLSLVIRHMHALLGSMLRFFFGLLVALILLAHEEAAAVRVPEVVAGEHCEVMGVIEG